MVRAWQDDPLSKLPPILRPVPGLATGLLEYRFKGPTVKAAKYAIGTPEFRYWTTAEALRRGADFWGPFLRVARWQPGAVLPVSLDKGVDLNAYYDRSELAFFHEDVAGTTVYSCESPDVAIHEMGHACLDAHRPELFDAPFVEAASFHESFGDMAAILAALQLPTVRAAALAGLKGNRASALSRCAEQLGWAIRQFDATAVDPDCLRDAHNAFAYVDPQSLPDDAPATVLCAEVHSFSRVFTGAFYEILSRMLKARAAKPTQANLLAVSRDLGQLLMDATAAAPIQPDYYAQVAAHMIDADTARFGGRYRAALSTTFVARLILPKSAVAPLPTRRGAAATARAVGKATVAAAPLPAGSVSIGMNARDFGHGNQPFQVVAPVEHKAFMSAAARLANRHVEADAVTGATHRFVKMLFARDRVEVAPSATRRMAVTAETRRDTLKKTHALVESKDGLRLRRRLFHCGSAHVLR